MTDMPIRIQKLGNCTPSSYTITFYLMETLRFSKLWNPSEASTLTPMSSIVGLTELLYYLFGLFYKRLPLERRLWSWIRGLVEVTLRKTAYVTVINFRAVHKSGGCRIVIPSLIFRTIHQAGKRFGLLQCDGFFAFRHYSLPHSFEPCLATEKFILELLPLVLQFDFYTFGDELAFTCISGLIISSNWKKGERPQNSKLKFEEGMTSYDDRFDLCPLPICSTILKKRVRCLTLNPCQLSRYVRIYSFVVDNNYD